MSKWEGNYRLGVYRDRELKISWRGHLGVAAGVGWRLPHGPLLRTDRGRGKPQNQGFRLTATQLLRL